MNKKLKNRIVFYTMLLVLFVIVNIVVSFAYLRGRANNNESVSTIAIEGGGSISVVYSDNTGDIVNDHIIPGYQTIKNFSVTSNISSGGQVYKRGIWYQIKLIVENNGFESGFLAYSLSLDENSSTDGIVALPVDNVEIPTGLNLDLLVGTGYFLNDNVTHIYNLKINYLNMDDVDQTANSQTKFFTRVVIDSPEYINLTFNLDGGSFENLKLNNNSTMKVAANSTIDFPVPIKENYIFMGWEIISGDVITNSNVISTADNDITLKALWIPAPFEFAYTGGEQQFIAEVPGYYKLEAWGAQGHGSGGAVGGYVSGQIYLEKNLKISIFIGGMPTGKEGGYNGGGSGYSSTAGGGGGATDIRYGGTSLYDRILVASGGAGNAQYNAGYGGGLTGYTGYDSSYSSYTATGGTQVSGGIVTNYSSSYIAGTNGSFGIGGAGGGAENGGSFGGGGGYYGGAGGSRLSSGNWPGGGGSSYISGHTGCVAIVSDSSTSARTGTGGASCTTGTSDNLCSVHYSGKFFTDTVMIDGAGYSWTNTKGSLQQMPNPSGGYYASGVGHSGNGFARITFLHI